MNIKGFSSPISTFSGPTSQAVQAGRQGGAGGIGGYGFPKGDSFEGKSSPRDPGLGPVLRNSLNHAGVSQSTSQAVMDAVRNGTPLDTALRNAGVTPEQHRIVMSSVQAQDRRKQL